MPDQQSSKLYFQTPISLQIFKSDKGGERSSACLLISIEILGVFFGLLFFLHFRQLLKKKKSRWFQVVTDGGCRTSGESWDRTRWSNAFSCRDSQIYLQCKQHLNRTMVSWRCPLQFCRLSCLIFYMITEQLASLWHPKDMNSLINKIPLLVSSTGFLCSHLHMLEFRTTSLQIVRG